MSTFESHEPTAKQWSRIVSALKKAGFIDITIHADYPGIQANHKRGVKGRGGHYRPFGELISRMGFKVPCSGLAGKFYAQVWNIPQKPKAKSP